MIGGLNNEKYYDTNENDGRVIFNNVKNRNIGYLMHYVCSCIRRIPLFHHEDTDAYTQGQENDRYILHNVVVTVTSSNRCPA